MSFTLGKELRLTIFGSSHGTAVGATVDGLPAGLRINEDYIAKWMERRRPSQSELTTQRKEEDLVELISGVVDNFTDGGAVTVIIRNKDVISSHYEELKTNPRPGHGDISLYYKYGEFRNYSGGGFLSGRMTAPIVAVGSVLFPLLKTRGIDIISYIDSLGPISCDDCKPPSDPEKPYDFKSRIPDKNYDLNATEYIKSLSKNGDSTGASIKTIVNGVPEGIGEPFFDSVESDISRAMFSIPGLKGIEFGVGFSFSSMVGSQANDEFYFHGDKILTRTNRNGGILGGISTGMPIEFRVVMKPTSSIRRSQRTVNLATREPSEIIVKGRHDPCIAIRAVPVVQSMTAIVITDLMLRAQKIPRVL